MVMNLILLLLLLFLNYYYSYYLDISGWGLSPRGAGYLFGQDVVEEFNKLNSIEYICRAH